MILTHGANSLERGGGNTVNIGGREYRTVTIGNQVWLAENLDYKFNGVEIGAAGQPITPAAWYYNNDEATYGVNGNKYGLLYNWYAVESLNNNRATLCPGWHVPTSDEWNALVTAVGGDSTAGAKLKSSTGWSSGNGTDDYGFSDFPAGWYGGSFYDVGSNAGHWTITGDGIVYRYFNLSTDSVVRQLTSLRDNAFSLRLVKDAP